MCSSFAPIEDAKARVLILGSMPGKASLAAAQYYAHAQNLFWHILGEVTGAGPALPYPARARALRNCGIALWDVLASCTREGSLDSAIDDASISANDFVSFYRAHPGITQVFFNGAKAEASYRKHVLPTLAPGPRPAELSPPALDQPGQRFDVARVQAQDLEAGAAAGAGGQKTRGSAVNVGRAARI